ncbi:MAG: hypothetical protein HY040_06355 [Planctomycetes bacterium]|nr:hypothetical protein [Planctomycetota bacterium]
MAGLLAAIHPFWIVNTAELSDGVLATFLLALVLVLGCRAGQVGGAFASLLFGLSLAALAMVRAAFLPFVLVGLLWFLWRCRSLKMGWFCAFLAILGFGNGLVPWSVRNFQLFAETVPIADSAFLHLWAGNFPDVPHGQMDDAFLRDKLAPDRLQSLLDEPNQAKRYAMLAQDWVEQIKADPGEHLSQRLRSALAFFFGEKWLRDTGRSDLQAPTSHLPSWLVQNRQAIFLGSLLAMLFLGGLGWRFSFGWRKESRLATLAVIWIPLPYLLSHAEALSGPRLPLDGILLCYSGFALASLWPGTRRVSGQGDWD